MFAALHIPDFAVVAVLRSCAEGRERPSAVLAVPAGREIDGKLPLLALNRAARGTGIAVAWPLNRALVRCPDLRVLERDPEAEAALRAELVRLGESLTPDLEVTAADAVLLDLSLRAGPVDEVLAAAGIEGVELWQARAATPDLAHLAARHESTCGRAISSADLEPLPLAVLASLARERVDLGLLEMWGLRTLGDFMKLPRQQLAERLGPEVGRWHDLLHAKSRRLLRLHRPPESLRQAFDFADAVTSFEPLVFALRNLLYTLSGRLAARHLAARHLDVCLRLESGDAMTRQLRLPEPQASVEGMLSPLQAMLEPLRLESAVVAIELDAGTTFATAAQREWFGRQLPQPERWAETLAKLEAMLGPGRVGIPLPPASFAPDGFTLHPAAGAEGPVPETAFRPDSAVPLQRFRPPREIAVAYESRARRPWPLALLSGPHPGRILDRRGPFPLSGKWWQAADAWQRLEWDVEVEGRQLLRLVFQPPDRWQLDGIYR